MRIFRFNTELRLLFFAVIIAVSAISSISLFSNRLDSALLQQGSQLLGGDLVIQSPQDLPKAFQAKAKDLGLNVTTTLTFLSMSSAKAALQLVSVKAVKNNYPLLGQIKTMNVRGNEIKTKMIPKPGDIWIAKRLLSALNIKLGDQIKIGAAEFTASRVLLSTPERSGSWFLISPQVLINWQDIARTKVVQPGSRLRYHFLVTGPNSAIKAFTKWAKPKLNASMRLLSPAQTQPSLENTLEQVNSYLNLAALLSVILAAVAISVALARFLTRHHETVALMRTFGSSHKKILSIFCKNLLFTGSLAIIIGIAIGVLGQYLLQILLTRFIQIELPAPTVYPIAFSFMSGLILLFGMALPHLIALKNISPQIIMRDNPISQKTSGLLTYGMAILTLAILIYLFTYNLRLLLLIIVIGGLCYVLFHYVTKWLLSLLIKLFSQVFRNSQFGLRQLKRHSKLVNLQIFAFSITITVMLVLSFGRTELLQQWKIQLPQDTPNYFAININPAQVKEFRAFLQQNNLDFKALYPMVRGRLIKLNQKPILSVIPLKAKTNNALHRELNLTFAENLPENNKLISGSWWTKTNSPLNEVSVEAKLARELNLKLGDTLTFLIGSQTLTAKIASIRTVDWSSFQPNFYMIFTLCILANFPMTFITSFYLPKGQQNVLNRLDAKFPSVTVIDVNIIMQQVRLIMRNAALAISLILLYTIAAGLAVLLATIYNSLDERIYHAAILRTLGATTQQIRRIQLTEFLVLGGIAGFLAAILSLLINWLLAVYVLKLTYHVSWFIMLLAPALAIIMITAVSLFAIRKTVKTSPLKILRSI